MASPKTQSPVNIPSPTASYNTFTNGAFRPTSLAAAGPRRFSSASLPDPTGSNGNMNGQTNHARFAEASNLETGNPSTSTQSNMPMIPKFRRGSRPAGPKYHWLHSDSGLGNTGDEPGVDVRSRRDEKQYSHLKGDTTITVVDYSSDPDQDNSNVKIDFPGVRLAEWFESPGGKRPVDDDGKPTGVRWIHVDGLNWDVIKTLTLQFSLHPLAVEDALRSKNSPRSKLDFYKDHLYLQILIQHMHPQDEATLKLAADALASGNIDKVVTSGREGCDAEQSIEQRVIDGFHELHDSFAEGNGTKTKKDDRMMELPDGVEGVFEPSVAATRLQQGSSPFESTGHRLTVDHLSAKYMVPIRRGVMSVFMTRDGTLISMTAKPCIEVLAPIYGRLEDERSLLRRSGDCSMLAEALLDVVVDLAIEVSQAFESEILKLEAAVLVDPEVEIVRHLHILSSQLIRLRRSLTPLLHVCYIVRDQDVQRSIAASALAVAGKNQIHGTRGKHFLSPSQASTPNFERPTSPLSDALMGGHMGGGVNVNANPNLVGQGFFSPMTKVYIGDVIDHLEIIVSSLDQFVATCDHLTDYVFNVLSFETNASMEILSIVTVVFLPLTFIASYFGMNFDGFDALRQDVSYFWKVATPLTVGFFLIFSFTYLRAAAQTIQRRVVRWRRTKMVERVVQKRRKVQ